MRTLVVILSKLPLSFLYFIADTLLFPLAYHIVRYRRKIVRTNLRQSFPQWTWKQVKRTERKFYRHLCNIIVEVIYGYGCSTEEMNRRMQFRHLEKLPQMAHTNKGVIMAVGHLGNFEWVAQIGAWLEPYGVQSIHVYRKQKHADQLLNDIRQKHLSGYCEMKQTLRTVIRQYQQDIPTAYGMVADQKPSPKLKEYMWIPFMGQDTAFLQGVETIARKFNFPVIYGKMMCHKRGYYVTDIITITENPNDEPRGYITKRYAELLEENIREQPELWLWSHNRWKYKRTQTGNHSDN